jgi:hypothetical protein
MNDKMLLTASEILKISTEEAKKNFKHIPDEDAFFFWNPVRGGLQMIIKDDGEKLVLGSAFSFDKVLAMFREGKRN